MTRRHHSIRIALLAASALAISPTLAADVTPERLANPDKEPQNWLMNHRSYDAQRFSPLARINKDNVKSLKLAYEIAPIVKAIAPGFGGINLEDISSPRCFEIENRLVDELDIPVFHDDQHGTAIVVLPALLNACRLTGRRIEELKVAMVGAGAAGVAVAKILMGAGVSSIVACDRYGAINTSRSDYQDGSMNTPKTWLAEHTNT